MKISIVPEFQNCKKPWQKSRCRGDVGLLDTTQM